MARIPPGLAATVAGVEVLVTFCKTGVFPIAPEPGVTDCRLLPTG